eukprot:3600567-Rhodomonas_salina.1
MLAVKSNADGAVQEALAAVGLENQQIHSEPRLQRGSPSALDQVASCWSSLVRCPVLTSATGNQVQDREVCSEGGAERGQC